MYKINFEYIWVCVNTSMKIEIPRKRLGSFQSNKCRDNLNTTIDDRAFYLVLPSVATSKVCTKTLYLQFN